MRDKRLIDTLFIPGKIFNGEEELAVENPIQCMPTILFCNPNGVIYESFGLQSEWIGFYTEKGINVFLWNYRGTG
jgi:hypothetical protein